MVAYTKEEFKEIYSYNSIKEVDKLIEQGRIIVNSDNLICTQDNALFGLKRKETLFKLNELKNSEKLSDYLNVEDILEVGIVEQVAEDLIILMIEEKRDYLLSLLKSHVKEIIKRVLYAQNPEKDFMSYITSLIEHVINTSMYDAKNIVNENFDKCLMLEKIHAKRVREIYFNQSSSRSLRKNITDSIESLNLQN